MNGETRQSSTTADFIIGVVESTIGQQSIRLEQPAAGEHLDAVTEPELGRGHGPLRITGPGDSWHDVEELATVGRPAWLHAARTRHLPWGVTGAGLPGFVAQHDPGTIWYPTRVAAPQVQSSRQTARYMPLSIEPMLRAFQCLTATLLLAPAIVSAQSVPPRQVDSSLIITDTEIQESISAAGPPPVADVRLRLVPVGTYNVGVSVVRRSQVDGRTPTDAIVHDAITEVYQIKEGRGILVIGGRLEDSRPFPSDGPVVRDLIGPSSRGTAIRGGVRRLVGPGDMVVIPPGTAHGFAELLTPEITYVIVRIDGERVLRLTP